MLASCYDVLHIAMRVARYEVRDGEGFGYTFKDPHGGWEVIDSSCGLESGYENRWRRHKIVCEGIVEVSLRPRQPGSLLTRVTRLLSDGLNLQVELYMAYLKLENILNLVELLLVSNFPSAKFSSGGPPCPARPCNAVRSAQTTR